MGHFLAVTAILAASAGDVSGEVGKYLKSHNVSYTLAAPNSSINDQTDAVIYKSSKNWTVILWPNYFNVHDFELASSLSKSKGWLISTVHVYDGDYWEHFAVKGNTELHSFTSKPNYWADDKKEMTRVSKLKPDPARLCTELGIPANVIAPYLVDADKVREGKKANAKDKSEISDYWVFVDFWDKLNIKYPDVDTDKPVAIIRMSESFGDKLP